jgi:hypothetical protein
MVTISAIKVAVTPVSALIPLSATQQFTGTLGWDPTADSIVWTLTQNGVVFVRAFLLKRRQKRSEYRAC